MSFSLKQALEFNKFTVGLAAAGLAYVSTVVGADSPQNQSASFLLKVVGTAALVLFAVSVLYGILVMGRATKLDQTGDKEIVVDDELMKKWGVRHSSTLLVGLLVAALLLLNKVWRWVT